VQHANVAANQRVIEPAQQESVSVDLGAGGQLCRHMVSIELSITISSDTVP